MLSQTIVICALKKNQPIPGLVSEDGMSWFDISSVAGVVGACPSPVAGTNDWMEHDERGAPFRPIPGPEVGLCGKRIIFVD